jgi:uncharacterized protein YndB with AHSA1/START domain
MPETETYRLKLSRVFDAPAELVWFAWTEPQRLMKWFNPNPEMKCPAAKMDMREGGRFRIQMQMPDGEYFTSQGTYLEVKPLERLVYTFAWEKDGSSNDFEEAEAPETQMTLEFRSLGDQTELTLIHEKFVVEASRDRHIEGWTGCLESLAKYLTDATKS